VEQSMGKKLRSKNPPVKPPCPVRKNKERDGEKLSRGLRKKEGTKLSSWGGASGRPPLREVGEKKGKKKKKITWGGGYAPRKGRKTEESSL